MGTPQAASALGISARTLRHWRQQENAQKLTAQQRGRKALACDVETRNSVIHFLHHVTGPSVGLPTLQCLFRQVPRCVLRELLAKYRRVWRRRYVQQGFRLFWHYAGTVWAMDHSEPKHPVDGIYPYLLAVRDLASSRQLAWHPVKTMTAEETLPILQELIQEHGAPLVLKSDNGSAFIADDLRGSMQEQEVTQLFSPPRRPAYNGALERSNGVLKTYTHQHAMVEGHPFRWTSDDLQHAMQLANTISRPWGHKGATPEEAWLAREPITAEQRAEFRESLECHRVEASEDLGLENQQTLSRVDQARCDRLALSRVLEELGYLTKQRMRRAPKKPKRPTHEDLAHRAQQYREKAAEGSAPAQSGAPQLVRSALDATMQASTARSRDGVDHSATAQSGTSAGRQRTIISWTWRFFTLLVSLVKAAIFSR